VQDSIKKTNVITMVEHGFPETWYASHVRNNIFFETTKQIEAEFPNKMSLLIDTTWFDLQNPIKLKKDLLHRYGAAPFENVDNVFFLPTVDECNINRSFANNIREIINVNDSVYFLQNKFEFWGFCVNKHMKVWTERSEDSIGHHFLCYNRKSHTHRLKLIKNLIEKDLVKYGVVTMGTDSHMAKHPYAINHLGNTGYNLDYIGKNSIPNDVFTMGPKSAWDGCFVNIVTETVYDSSDDYIFLSEKIWKPILGKMPFICVGPRYTMQRLRDYGFKTFGNWWDENYDNLPNEERIDGVISVIEDIVKYDIDKLQELYRDMKNILAFNYFHMLTNFHDKNTQHLNDLVKERIEIKET